MFAFGLWLPTTVFCGIIAWRVARTPEAPSAPIADMRAALITAAYSLGGAAILLGVAWLAVAARDRRAILSSGALWLAVTAMLLATRQVSGWSLVVAAIIAAGIGIDVMRRLLSSALASLRAELTER